MTWVTVEWAIVGLVLVWLTLRAAAATLAQRAEWAEAVEKAVAFGADPAEVEEKICGSFGAKRFEDLSQEQAAQAIQGLLEAVAKWQAPPDDGGEGDAGGGVQEYDLPSGQEGEAGDAGDAGAATCTGSG